MGTAIKIRGIYATALTRFFIDHGYDIVSPSGPIAERFREFYDFPGHDLPQVTVRGRKRGHGIKIHGETKLRETVSRLIRDKFWDAAFYDNAFFDTLHVELSSVALAKLDDIRNSVIPTLAGHHRFRKMENENLLDLVETKTLPENPEKRDSLSRDMEKRLVWDTYGKGKWLKIKHVKLNDKAIKLSPGQVVEADFGRGSLKLKRTGFRAGGKYDGLNVPIRDGDFCITRIERGDWFYYHTYYRKDGEVVGEYWNINTPVEFYPEKIRYLDLEIDLVKSEDTGVRIIDEDQLRERFESGVISERLKHKAKTVASELSEKLGYPLGLP